MKDLHEDDIFGSVRERLGRYEEAPSEAVWDRIAAKKRKGVAAWPVWAGAGVLAIAGLVWFLSFEVKEAVVEKKALTEKEVTGDVKGTEQKQSTEHFSQTAPITQITPIKYKAQKEFVDDIVYAQSSTESLTTSIVYAPKDSASALSVRHKSDSSSLFSPLPAETVIPPYKRPKSKFQLYFSLSPSLSFQKIIPSGNDAIIVQGLASHSPLSMKRFGFGIDAGFQRDINNIFGFYGGLSLYQQHQQLTYFYYDHDAEVTRVGDSWTFEINRPQHSKTFDYTMTNIGVRSGLLVTLKGEKLKHKFGAGLLFAQGFAKETGSYNNRGSGYLSYQIFYRNEVRINDRFSWFVEPMFTYSFISKEKLAEPFQLKPYRAGISGGVLYRF